MSLDLPVVEPTVSLQPSQVSLVQVNPYRILYVVGEDFRAVGEVLIGGWSSPYFEVISSTALLVDVPDAVPDSSLSQVEVRSVALTLTKKSKLSFVLHKNPTPVQGLLKLLQGFCKLLIQTPGTNLRNRSSGGGLFRLLARSVDKTSATSLIGDVQICVSTTARQLIAIQARQPQLPPHERLLSAEVIGKQFHASTGTLAVTVDLRNQANQSAQALVGL
jgi:hypothetical protein